MTNTDGIDAKTLMILNEIRNTKADLKNDIANINNKIEEQGAEIATMKQQIEIIPELLARIEKIEKAKETYASKGLFTLSVFLPRYRTRVTQSRQK